MRVLAVGSNFTNFWLAIFFAESHDHLGAFFDILDALGLFGRKESLLAPFRFEYDLILRRLDLQHGSFQLGRVRSQSEQ